MDERESRPHRRFEEVEQRIRGDVSAGGVDEGEARWFLLARQLTAQHAHERWLLSGAPRRRASDVA